MNIPEKGFTRRSFSAFLKSISNKKGLLDKQKIAALTDDILCHGSLFSVRERMAIVKDFIGPGTDMAWLQACGYLYHAHNKHFTFLCTSENRKVGP